MKNNWISLATRWSTVRRALMYSLIVGVILVVINHSDAFSSGDIPIHRIVRMSLTFFVPYLVSTFSSVGAFREMEGRSLKK